MVTRAPDREVYVIVNDPAKPVPWSRYLRIDKPDDEIRADLCEIAATYELERADLDRQTEELRAKAQTTVTSRPGNINPKVWYT